MKQLADFEDIWTLISMDLRKNTFTKVCVGPKIGSGLRLLLLNNELLILKKIRDNSSKKSPVKWFNLIPALKLFLFFLSFIRMLWREQLFGDNDIFQQYGIPMNPTDTTTIPGMEDRQRGQNASGSAGSQLISYQQGQQPIDFTDFLNLDDNDLALNAGSFSNEE